MSLSCCQCPSESVVSGLVSKVGRGLAKSELMVRVSQPIRSSSSSISSISSMTCLDELEEVVAQQHGEVRVHHRAVRVRRGLSAHLLRGVV